MIHFDEISEIRSMYFRRHMSVEDICNATDHCYRTVMKYLEMDDFNLSNLSSKNEKPSKLDPWKEEIQEWLKKDREMPAKQRHTSQRIYDRLVEKYPEFSCSYGTVNLYVQQTRKEMRLRKRDPKIPLVHNEPGIAQADFGNVWFKESSLLYEGHELVVSFPYSNGSFSILTYGENAECLLEGLDKIFRFIGGVPPEMWFDNASTMVSKIIRGGPRKTTEKFRRFCEHYHIHAVFMNAAKGNEKGNVEANVGINRRNLFVPLPEFDDLDQYNDGNLKKCLARMDKDHYQRGIPIKKLFEDDRKNLNPLPEKVFDTSSVVSLITNETGLFTLDKNYTYSTSPDYERQSVSVRITSKTVTVMKEDLKTVIVTHKRLYGNNSYISIQWGPYLRVMSRKPRSFLNSDMKDMLPEELRIFLLSVHNSQRGQILETMADLYEAEGFEAVKRLCLRAAVSRDFEPDDFLRLCKQMYAHVPLSRSVSPAAAADKDVQKINSILIKAMKGNEKNCK